MRFTRQAEIAVELLVLCARSPMSTPVTTRAAAAATGTTKDHAAQIVKDLIRHGLLTGTRGRGGGIRLARAAGHIRVGQVLRLMQVGFDDLGEATGGRGGTAFDMLLQTAMRSFVAAFDDFTIADLALETSDGRLACLDCDLRTLINHGQMLSRLRRSDHAALPQWTAAS